MEEYRTQASIFAGVASRKMAKSALNTILIARWGATVIMVAAMYVSFDHQELYLESQDGMTPKSAHITPLVLDVLAVICVKVLGTFAMKKKSKRVAAVGLVLPIAASGTLNFIAPGTLVAKLVYVVIVVCIVIAETVSGNTEPDFDKMDAMERKLARPLGEAANTAGAQQAEVTVPDTVAELEKQAAGSAAPVSPAAPAAETQQHRKGRPGRPAQALRLGEVPPGKHVPAVIREETGKPAPERTSRRVRNQQPERLLGDETLADLVGTDDAGKTE